MYQSQPADAMAMSQPESRSWATAAGQVGIELHAVNHGSHRPEIGPDGGEDGLEGLEMGDPPGSISGPVIRQIGRQERFRGQFVEIVPGHRAVEVGHKQRAARETGVVKYIHESSSLGLLGSPARHGGRAGDSSQERPRGRLTGG